MNNALGYFILCRVWQYLLERNAFDSLDAVSAVKSLLINEGIPREQMILADNAHRWAAGMNFSTELEVK